MRPPTFHRVLSSLAALGLLALAGLSIALAFPATHPWLNTLPANLLLWGLLLGLAALTLRALLKRRWTSALFHGGFALVIVGGAITAGYAETRDIGLVDSPIAPPELCQADIGGETVSLERFAIETYPGSAMPKQYRSRLRFPDGAVREVSVNRPLRRNGFTIYQMSYTRGWDPYGNEVFQTILTVRRDPGARWVFAGYGVLAAATLLAAIRGGRP